MNGNASMHRLRRPLTTTRVRRLLAVIALGTSLSAIAGDGVCEPLQAFLDSVAMGETRALEFHVIVGSNFKGRDAPAYGARRCDYAGYEPGKALCSYLMTYGSVESPGYNAKQVIGCLSPKTKFAPGTWLYAISFGTKVGTDARGTRVDVVLAEDQELGGTSLTIKASGYGHE